MIRAGIYGVSGYAGFEVFRLLRRHPMVEIVFSASESGAGSSLAQLFPVLEDFPIVSFSEAPLDQVDVVFLALPHGVSAAVARQALAVGVRVIDLSADFRLKDPIAYARWYKEEHSAPDLLSEAVYGLTEWNRSAIRSARLIANPGCYPTATLLALLPLVRAGAVGPGPIIVDAKSGVSGAGRKPSLNTHFVEVDENLSPYNIGRVHRHLPEIEQMLHMFNGTIGPLVFSPQLLPVARGILATIYVPLASGWTEGMVRDLLVETYGPEPFVKVLPPGNLATLRHSVGTNLCVLSVTGVPEAGMVILTASIDNLIKGAAGQAVQNLNVMFGLPETAGLL
ncbi:N-acetyl-gamma-glutamyl-phosphate reductase [Thermoflexus sp.]|uniref:N-acetyl-gamma-glutamyl-phosphate reductase n=1 Tax=Thermoflexus sp. TaxID=1969742 RepID=UPI0025D120E4|nr:N-acetyl-gamma-glutamyl-phosphate reductase [Thermoflexus sp.]MDW8180720.1 N-acetyl-gamma-glutamyl-phosphate reductase [Anaerolineae bacterium]MCS6963205.1 N-acetyl-gamma-glutamyl-phosphate reductase [Thermoflexus sp.]MCS7351266.1 N-acetyl-gamma-glutamyl-phosphate reductase [Thermoflexus sp.]MCX7690279.1 N-acetyl-gamma-glutamyl-phosphate reductase [Thermoflexus sp.]MDW8184876.1 N-acetyl-gamma-glutamyl-phosphate reductase [Anaerolineae bacterium]